MENRSESPRNWKGSPLTILFTIIKQISRDFLKNTSFPLSPFKASNTLISTCSLDALNFTYGMRTRDAFSFPHQFGMVANCDLGDAAYPCFWLVEPLKHLMSEILTQD